ncbi:hypothetical protein D1BOALGB6SA_8124 [Olavius sp. associated proteobacterium Delta 1]|nr:hypothetical protein D1BOALGB6SA_8124 [Olavius sp. associated proteobacterium Delta 1]
MIHCHYGMVNAPEKLPYWLITGSKMIFFRYFEPSTWES